MGTHGAVRGLGRLEGFSDAVFAIALTLLIVEIKIPGSPEGPHGYTELVGAMASVTLVAGLALTACTWMGKWSYGMPGRRVMDERLAPDFLQQMTRRYGIATLIQITAVPVAVAAPRVGAAVALVCVAFFLLPQPKPRYKAGEEPSGEEKSRQ